MSGDLPPVEYKKRIARVIPFGWKVSATNKDVLESIPLEIAALKQIEKYYKTRQYSLRSLSDWLFSVTGRRISNVGVYKHFCRIKKAQRSKRIRINNPSINYSEIENRVRKSTPAKETI